MLYLIALICPPLSLMIARRWFQAILCWVLYALAIAGMESGFGALIAFFLILWAFRIKGERDAEVEARAFIKTVEPIPYIHSRAS